MEILRNALNERVTESVSKGNAPVPSISHSTWAETMEGILKRSSSPMLPDHHARKNEVRARDAVEKRNQEGYSAVTAWETPGPYYGSRFHTYQSIGLIRSRTYQKQLRMKSNEDLPYRSSII